MSIINRVIAEINKHKINHSQRPSLISIGLREKYILSIELFPKFREHLPNHFYGIKTVYTEKESELRVS